MPRRIVIIGANATGVEAAAAARKTDRTAEITLVISESRAGYSRCGIPFVIGGQIKDFSNLIVYPQAFFQMMKLNLRTETTATNIDTKNKIVEVQDKTGKQEKIQYDSLVIATGASPFIPPIKGKEKKGVYVVRTLEDGEKIEKALKQTKKAVVIGAGAIGLEVAVALTERGVKTTVIEFLPYALPLLLDQDMAEMVSRTLEEKGISLIFGKAVEEILGTDKAEGVLVSGEKIETDMVIAATGVRADFELAKKSGITIGERAIKVNTRMETNVKDVYAAGDCVETPHLVTHRPFAPQLGTSGVRQGKVAGTNAAGGYAIFPGVLGSAVTKLFDLEIGGTGLSEWAAKREGIETITGTITSKTRADYYPDAKPIKTKIIIEKETGRIIGAQIVGEEEVTQRVNALSFAITKHMTVQELAKADTCYAPPLSETWEAMVLAAETALMKIKRR
jgi:NADH oxidase (H2O2-forming)